MEDACSRTPDRLVTSFDARPFLFFGFVFVPSVVILVLQSIGYNLAWMRADRSTLPLGALTTNFVNDTPELFAVNMSLLALFLWGYSIVNSRCRPNGWRELALAVAAFLGSVLGILYLVYLGGSGTGSSGIVYGTAGVTLGFALVQRGWVGAILERGMSRSKFNSYLLCLGLLLGPGGAFLASGNKIVHVVALIVGGFAGYGIGRQSRSRKA